MKKPKTETISWDGILGTKTVAYHALTSPGKVRKFIPPGPEALDDVLFARRKRFDDAGYRTRLVESVSRGLQTRGAPESSLQACRRLERPDSFLVIAGQQAGLLGGPLYTVYKVATAIALANRLSAERDDIFLPCFWCASEDHDYEEVRGLSILDADSKVREFRLPDLESLHRPVYDIPTSICPLDELTEFLEGALRSTEFTPWLLEIVRETHAGSRSLSEWTARFLWSLFPDDGILILFPEDGFYQREAAEILTTEIQTPERSGEALRAAAAALEDLGLDTQIHKGEGRTSFFLVRGKDGDRERVPVYSADGSYTAAGETCSAADLIRLFEQEPLTLSAAASLRPVCQDAAFPTAVNILGPGEMNYHAQIGEIYRMHDVSRPASSIRLSATVLPGRLARWLRESAFDVEDFQKDTEWLVRETVRRSDGTAASRALDDLRGQIERSFDQLEEEVRNIDPSLGPAMAKDRKGMEKRVSQIESLINRRRADKEKTLHGRIETLQSHLYPRGLPQERVLNPLTFLNLFGTEFINVIGDLAGGDVREGHVLLSL